MSESSKLCIITTGGTIDKVYFDAASEFEVGDSVIESILKQANVNIDYRIIELARKDSLDLDDADRELIRATVEEVEETSILITHGTDTITETATYLASITDKTIVFTGSMQPARFSNTDAIFNIGAAVTATQVLPSGLYIAMNGRVLDALKVKKNRASLSFEDI